MVEVTFQFEWTIFAEFAQLRVIELAAGIRTVGVEFAEGLQRIAGDRFVVLDGHHRGGWKRLKGMVSSY
jgi:hypothetical protein